MYFSIKLCTYEDAYGRQKNCNDSVCTFTYNPTLCLTPTDFYRAVFKPGYEGQEHRYDLQGFLHHLPY